MFTFITPGSCFAGTLLELALASDRIYMLQTEEEEPAATVTLSPMNFGLLPMVSGHSRLAARFYDDTTVLDTLREEAGVPLSPPEALSLGLVTDTPDALDWDDELRQAIESRVALSPDALTGMEANLRFGPSEDQGTRIFGRLSAWQNWIFIRPNATGEKGALKVYGSGAQPQFNWERV
jgi:benzoyl-CoA-dihydrodiol lyase